MSKPPVRIKISKEHPIEGYHAKDSTSTRHQALLKAYHRYGGLTLIHKLNAIAVLTKNKPYGATFREDQQYISELYKRYKT